MINKATCGDKTRYTSRQEAITAIDGIANDRRSTKSKTKPTKSYFCTVCQGFHIYTESRKKILRKQAPKNMHTEKVFKRERQLVIRNFSSKPIP